MSLGIDDHESPHVEVSSMMETAHLPPKKLLEDLTTEQVDALVAEEMTTKLTLHERERVYNDCHGVPDVIPETGQLLKDSLGELQQHIDTIVSEGLARSDYVTALAQTPDYVLDPDFRLSFLRAASFDTKQAAERIILHFEVKSRMFGKHMLTKDISPSDLNELEQGLLCCGYMEMLPQRDSAGRAIIVERMPLFPEGIALSKIFRPMWCAAMTASRDVSIQQRGIVGILYCTDLSKRMSSEYLSKSGELQFALPIRMSSYHVCCADPSIWYGALGKMRFYMDRPCRLRAKPHFGTDIDLQNQLRGFGIPMNPFRRSCATEDLLSALYSAQSKWRVVKLYAEIVNQRQKRLLAPAESSSNGGRDSNCTKGSDSDSESLKKSTMVACIFPQPTDVLSGRGKSCVNPGNVRLRQLVEDHALHYKSANRAGKTNIVRQIMLSIRDETGGRFLKRRQDDADWMPGEDTDGGSSWIELPEDVAHEKVRKLFRQAGKKKPDNNDESP